MTIVFDGKKFALEKEKSLKVKVISLLNKGIKPKLASIIVGNDPASVLYTSLKKKVAERVGIEFAVISLNSSTEEQQIAKTIGELNKDSSVQGIMIQLPLPSAVSEKTSVLLNLINPLKDVDGLRDDSLFVPATVRAVLSIIAEAKNILDLDLNLDLDYCVVGVTGMVGKSLNNELKRMKVRVKGVSKQTNTFFDDTKRADILISTTGVPGIIKSEMVKKGAIVIDVGSPRGDVDFKSVVSKVSFITPVPGGVGPVTIVSLLENLLEACYNTGNTHTLGMIPERLQKSSTRSRGLRNQNSK